MKKMKNFKVDFIGIGAGKCATTWIAQCLKEHPEICLSKVKEVRFFNVNGRYREGIKYYQSYFDRCPQNIIKGEFTPGYIDYPDTARKIKKYFPSTKLIACIRNPIERAYSHYWYEKVKGFELNEFKESIKKNPHYVETGFYYKKMEPFFALFPKENILILIYEDIVKNPIKFIQEIYEFLKVKEDFIPPSIDRKIWVTSADQFPFAKINKIIMKFIKTTKKNIFLKKIAPLTELLGFKRIIFLFYKLGIMKKKMEGKKPLFKPPMEKEVRKFLQRIYKQDIKNLENLINRNLSFWE